MNVREQIVGGIKNTASNLDNFCLEWRESTEPYPLRNIVRRMVKSKRSNEVFSAIFDPEFSRRRKQLFGFNALRDDLETVLKYFSLDQVDLPRYLKVLYLEQSQVRGDVESVRAHQRHCEAFEQFFQLETPSHKRSNIGMHKVLAKMFPMDLNAEQDAGYAYNYGNVTLTSYELGNWTCRCGRRRGHSARFQYSCPCGNLNGNDNLDNVGNLVCDNCLKSASYVLCQSCHTRVGLDLIWKLNETAVHPSILRLPLVVHLLIRRGDERTTTLQLPLIEFPMPIGINEQAGQIGFELPAMLWLQYSSEENWRSFSPLASIDDNPSYDRQTDLLRILEAVFRRTLLQSGGSLKSRLKRIPSTDQRQTEFGAKVASAFSRSFIKRLNRAVINRNDETNLIRLADFSRDSHVGSIAKIDPRYAIVNERMAVSNGFSLPMITTLVAVLRNNQFGVDELTNAPAGKDVDLRLDADGIVVPGTVIRYGTRLIGIQTPMSDRELAPEERLLRAIFGENANDVKDSSLIYRMHGEARILLVDVFYSKALQEHQFTERPGKAVRLDTASELAKDEIARVSITILGERKLSPGDTLFRNDGTSVIVDRILGERDFLEIAKGMPETDVLISGEHRWSHGQKGESSERVIRLQLKPEGLASVEMFTRGRGRYQQTTQQPLDEDRKDVEARLTEEHFHFLYSHGAQYLAMELSAVRCDYPLGRRHFYHEIISGKRRLGSLLTTQSHGRFQLESCPSETVRNWAFLVKSCCIAQDISLSADAGIAFTLMTDTQVREYSRGEVKNPETLNYRTLRPEKGGLFCERIFGPISDWECACGKYKRIKHKGTVCDRCGVEVTLASSRRVRFGHIVLAQPCVHPWFFRGRTSWIGKMLDIGSRALRSVIYCESYIVIDPGHTAFKRRQIISEEQLVEAETKFETGTLRVGFGGDGIKQALEQIDVPESIARLKSKIEVTRSERRRKQLRVTLDIFQGLHSTNTLPCEIVREVIPVLPPELRPMLILPNGMFRSCDLNELYQRVVNRSSRLKNLKQLRSPHGILRNETRALQEAVDNLFDNLHSERAITTHFRRRLISLSDQLRFASRGCGSILAGLFLRSVDYCARVRVLLSTSESVDTAILPDWIAWEIFAPLIVRELVGHGAVYSKKASEMVELRTEEAYRALRALSGRMVILADFGDFEVPFIAFRAEVTNSPVLRVHSDVLKLFPGSLSAKAVSVYAVLSAEGEAEAISRLLPSVLGQRSSTTEAELKEPKVGDSALRIAPRRLTDEIARRAISGEKFLCSQHERLLFCTTASEIHQPESTKDHLETLP